MRKFLLAAAAAALAAACQPASPPSTSSATTTATSTAAAARDISSDFAATAPYIVAAIADTHRPAADRTQDAARHPAETLALSGVAPGQKIAELLPGEAYFTRLFSNAVGAQGRVYAVSRTAHDQYEHVVLEGTANVTNVIQPYDHFTVPSPVDLVFTARNYHDFKINQYQMGDTLALDRAAFAALRPGGLYVIIDHSAVAGAVEDQVHPLHRIDQAVVRREVESVGFVYDGESQILRNPQ
ncbi:MAG: class I SAM-dependent methyltransferase, partial [Proteobacteria bacterium]|nr:class I SAM-dependent methyltransferase [Pseudomonadota bacterium]